MRRNGLLYLTESERLIAGKILSNPGPCNRISVGIQLVQPLKHTHIRTCMLQQLIALQESARIQPPTENSYDSKSLMGICHDIFNGYLTGGKFKFVGSPPHF